MPFIDDINNLREGTWERPYGTQANEEFHFAPFSSFFDRIVNNDFVFRHREDYKCWMEELTDCIDTNKPPTGFTFFPQKEKIDILATWCAFNKLGLKSLILRQEFPPEQDLSIDDISDLDNVADIEIEPFSYLLLYKEKDIEPLSNKIDKWAKDLTQQKKKLINNPKYLESVIKIQENYWKNIKKISPDKPDKKEEYIKWKIRTLGTEAVLRSKYAVPPWVDGTNIPKHKYRATIIFGNQNYSGTMDDLGEDILKNSHELAEYKHIKEKISNRKVR